MAVLSLTVSESVKLEVWQQLWALRVIKGKISQHTCSRSNTKQKTPKNLMIYHLKMSHKEILMRNANVKFKKKKHLNLKLQQLLLYRHYVKNKPEELPSSWWPLRAEKITGKTKQWTVVFH